MKEVRIEREGGFEMKQEYRREFRKAVLVQSGR
jgi:hypothetical protein